MADDNPANRGLGHTKEERMKVQPLTLRNQSSDQLKRLIYNMRLETAQMHGILAPRKEVQGKAIPLRDPKDRFRRRVVARCMTILRERGEKV